MRIAVPLLLVAGSWFGYRLWRSDLTLLTFLPLSAGALPPLELTFYPERVTFSSPSPPPALGTLHLQGEAELSISSDLVPDTALVRYSGPGVGTGYTRVVRGRSSPPLQLRPAAGLSGRVGTPRGFFCFGLRALGLEPVAGARVLGLGGGHNGVPLCDATTDADGRFQLQGFSSGLPVLGVRVLAEGFALAFVNQPTGLDDALIVPLVPTQPIEGRVDLPAAVTAASLRVLAKGLPGVEAPLATDGSFRLDHVPPDLSPRLLLHGLPPGFTHRLVHGTPGDRGVEIAVLRAARIRGFVVDRQTQQRLGGAMVWHENGPGGWVQTEADADGAFELDLVPPGQVTLSAQLTTRDPLGHKDTQTGERRLAVEEGVDQDGIVVRLD